MESPKNAFQKYSFLWVTLAFFIISLIGHWGFAWQSYTQKQQDHNQPIALKDYFNETMKDTLENWQSEFLQLIWQVGGLAFLLYVGSPQSKEGDDRKEAKLDLIIKKLDPKNASKEIMQLDKEYARS